MKYVFYTCKKNAAGKKNESNWKIQSNELRVHFFSPNYRLYSVSRVELISDSNSKFVTCHPRNLISVELYWRM